MLPSTSFDARFQLTNKAEFLKVVYTKEDQFLNGNEDVKRPAPARTFQFRSYLKKDGLPDPHVTGDGARGERLPALSSRRPSTSASAPTLFQTASLRNIKGRTTRSFLSSSAYGSFYGPGALSGVEPTFPPEPLQLVERKCRDLRRRKQQLQASLQQVDQRIASRRSRQQRRADKQAAAADALRATRAVEEDREQQQARDDAAAEQQLRDRQLQLGYLDGICARCGHAKRDHDARGGQRVVGRFRPRGKRRVRAHQDNLSFTRPGETPPFLRERPDTSGDSWGPRATVCDSYEGGSLGPVNHTGGTPRDASRPAPTFTLAYNMPHTKAYPIFWPTDPQAAPPRDFAADKAKLLASKRG